MRLEKLIFSVDGVMMGNITDSFAGFVELLLRQGFPPPLMSADNKDIEALKISLPGMIGGVVNDDKNYSSKSIRSIVCKSSGIVLTSTEIFYPEKIPKIPKFYDGQFYHQQPRYDYTHMVDLWGSPRKVLTLSKEITRIKIIQGYQAGTPFRGDM